MATVRLIAFDNSIYTEGQIADETIGEVSSLIWNERPFIYIGMRDGGKLTFKEVSQPYRVTEF